MKRVFLFLTLLLTSAQASACPDVLGYVDTNCDGVIRFMLTGDSIVRGIGDEAELGGYPGRLQRLIGSEKFRAINVGVPGADAQTLKRAFIRNIDRGRKTTRSVEDIDFIFTQIGTNGYWRGFTPSQSAMKMLRLIKYLLRALKERNGTLPVYFSSTVPLSERGYQNPFLQELNTELLRMQSRLHLLVRFDTIPVEELDIHDTLHPGAAGYTKMAKLVRSGLKRAQKYARQQFHDRDSDGVYDEAEVGRFLTNPTLADSDGDGLTDGEEILIYKTNPNRVDTDGDSVDDLTELLDGRDPLTPEAP